MSVAQPSPVPPLLRAPEVAAMLGLSRSKVYALLASGDLPSIRIGRSVRCPHAALLRWIDDNTRYARDE